MLWFSTPAHVDPIDVAKKVIEGLFDGVTTSELDNLAAETAASLTTKHPDYALLKRSRVAVSNLHKNTTKSCSETMRRLHQYMSTQKTGKNASVAGRRRLGYYRRQCRAFWTAPSFTIAILALTTSVLKP